MSNPEQSTAQVQHGDPLIGADIAASGTRVGQQCQQSIVSQVVYCAVSRGLLAQAQLSLCSTRVSV